MPTWIFAQCTHTNGTRDTAVAACLMQSYMEDHLKNKDRLNREWEGLLSYEADPSSTAAALLPKNRGKNRYIDILPYDHSRVILNDLSNCSKSDYINANTIVSLTYSHICFSPSSCYACVQPDAAGFPCDWEQHASSISQSFTFIHSLPPKSPLPLSFPPTSSCGNQTRQQHKDHWRICECSHPCVSR